MKNLTNSMEYSLLEKLTITPVVKKFHAIRHNHIKKYACMYDMLELFFTVPSSAKNKYENAVIIQHKPA